mmetsp:Transcript_13691/g.20528  ORF Transcript_13691/g.20528 Transcript_13691/m.20528 type:complete len:310 (+) Transcript_13691:214-1143(+)
MIVGIDTDAQLIENATMLGKRLIFSHEKGNFDQLQEGELLRKNGNVNSIPNSSQISLIPRPFIFKSTNNHKVDSNLRSQVFPYNLKFLCKDVFQLSSSSIYDNVICFSVVKWVHLNEGDTGLIRFFHRLYSLLKPNGSLFLEFQPWKSYVSNRSTSDTTKSVFPTIKVRPENFRDLLTKDIGFSFERNIGTALEDAKGYDRPIYWLRKLPTSSVKAIVMKEVISSELELDTNGISSSSLSFSSSIQIDVKKEIHMQHESACVSSAFKDASAEKHQLLQRSSNIKADSPPPREHAANKSAKKKRKRDSVK